MSSPKPDPLIHIIGAGIQEFRTAGCPNDQLRRFISEQVWEWLATEQGRLRLIAYWKERDAQNASR